MPTKVKTKAKRKYKPQHTKVAAKKRAAPAKAAREEKEQIPKQSFLKRLIFGEEEADVTTTRALSHCVDGTCF